MSGIDVNKCRELKIKTGIVKRMTKDVLSYEKEATQQEEKIEKLKVTSDDEYLIKKQIEVLEESQKMIPDTIRRLKIALEELQDFVVSETNLSSTEEYKTALDTISAAKPVINH